MKFKKIEKDFVNCEKSIICDLCNDYITHENYSKQQKLYDLLKDKNKLTDIICPLSVAIQYLNKKPHEIEIVKEELNKSLNNLKILVKQCIDIFGE